MFRIEMMPAGHGDCLWIEYGSQADPQRVLIDGGTAQTYEFLRQRLERLPKTKRRFELVIVTHVDADHIEGAVRLLGDRQLGLKIEDVWFNSWRHLAAQPEDTLGPVQGEYLSALIRSRNLPWNKALGGEAVAVRGGGLPPIPLTGGLRLTLLAPAPEGLAKLRKVWKREVERAGLDPDNMEAALQRLAKTRKLLPADALGEREPDVPRLARAPYSSDRSVANGSSIALLAEFDGKRALFAGDAHPPAIEASLRRLLGESSKGRLKLDAFKISHHGGKSNLSAGLLELVDCPRYLVSTNGNYFGHPDLESIARILVHGGKEPRLLFNYRSESNRVWNNRRLMRKYGYEAVYPVEGEQGLVVEL